MADLEQEIAALYAALDEVGARRLTFSESAYKQITSAIQDQIRRLQSESPPVEDDEIRLVTIMFIDIVNSTQMSLSLNADDWKATVGTAHNRVAGLIHQYGGVVGQYLGDGLLCFFGSTLSRDDDAMRAVHCALEIQAVIARYGQEIYVKHDLVFNVRIGISTGRAVVGLFGSHDNRTMLALGTPTNLAARLQNVAQAGETLVDAQTYRLVREHFDMESYPAAVMHGFEAPVHYYAVLGQRDRRATQLTSPYIASFEIDFVGREAEQAQIMDILSASLHARHWSSVIVVGEVGLGKSRLLQMVLDSTRNAAFELMLIVGNYQRRSSAYSLLQDLLTTRCQLKDDMSRSEIEHRIVAYIKASWNHDDAESTAHVMGYLAGLGFADSPHLRSLQEGKSERSQMALATVAHWFRAQAEGRPLLLLVDNLHWLDHSSLRLLEYLAQELADLPGAIVAASRPTIREHYPQYMQGQPHHHEIELVRLGQESIDSIIEAVFAQVQDVPEVLLDLIRQRAEGNPLFVEEFVYMLLDNGIIEKVDGERWRINRFQYSMRSSALPDGLLALLQIRLDELPATARQVVQIAATIGSSFWPSAMIGLVDAPAIKAALDSLEARGMILPQAESDFENEPAYRFRHGLYRDVVYSMLTRQHRAHYHRHMADWLRHRVDEHPEYLEALAEHYLAGEQNADSLRCYHRAALDRSSRGMMSETLALVEKGLNAARDVPRDIALPIVSHLWVIQARTFNALNRYEEASAASETALMLLDELPQDTLSSEKASAARTLGHSHLSLGRYNEAFDALNRANSLLPKDNQSEHAAVLRTFGRLFQARGQLNESLAYQQQAFAMAEDSGDEREISRVVAMLSMIALDRGDFATAFSYCEQVLQRNRDEGNTYYQILDLRQLVLIYYALFAYEDALRICDEAEILQERAHYRDPLLESIRALCWIEQGEVDTGMAILKRLTQNDYQSAEIRYKIQLDQVRALGLTGAYPACLEMATALLDDIAESNLLLHGRALLWRGIAMHALGDSEGQVVIQEALDSELNYGGRYAWQCYLALGRASQELAAQQDWYNKALNTLEATTSSLHTRPHLQAVLRESAQVRWLKQQLAKVSAD